MADKIRVLYVDDEPGLLEIGQDFLELSGDIHVETSTSAEKSLDSPALGSYDVIISDYQMPGMDGIAFLKTIRERSGDIPFILFTGRGREEVVIEAINNGADFYLQKGGDPEAQFAELAHKVRQAMRRKQAERSLQDSERRLLDIIDFLPDATFAIDRAGTVIAWNRACEEMTGVPAREMIGKGDFAYAIPFYGSKRPILIDLINEPDEKISHNYSNIYWTGTSLTGETDLPHPQGHRISALAKACPLYNQSGEIVGAIESIRDISERKRAEETIARSKDYLNQIISSIQAGIAIIDSATHEIVDINPAGAAMIGLSKEQIIGNTCHKFICPAETGQCPITDLHKNFDNAERILVTGEGKQIPIIKYVTRTNLDGRECLLETFIDNSERKRADDAVRESEAKYRDLADLLPQMVYELDPEFRITYANRHALTVFGFTNKDLEHGINALSFIDPSEHAAVKENVQKSLNGIPFEPREYTARRKDGSTFPVIIYSAPIYKNENLVGFRGVIVDISARKKLESGILESEKKFRAIFENSPYPIAINSLPDNKFLEINKAFLNVSGYSEEEILGKDPVELGLLPLTEVVRLISHRVLTGKLENVPLALTAKEGKRIHVLFSTMPVTINNKPAMVTMTAEITKLKRVEEDLLQKNEDLNAAYEEITAVDEELRQSFDELSKKEEAIRASEAKFRALVELSLDGILITDFTGNLLFVNRAAGLIVDVADYEAVAGTRNVMEFVAPESQADVLRDTGNVSQGNDAYLVHYKLITKTKREIWVECIGKKIPFQGSDAMLVSMRDVTERELAEKLVRDSEIKFSTVFRSSPVALTLVSAADGKFVDVNDAFSGYTGYSRDEMIGTTSEAVGLFADIDEYGRFVSALRKQQTVHGWELKCRVKSGEIRTCLFSSGIIPMSGKPHILSTVEDITERKATEAALQAIVRSMVGTTGLNALKKITETISSWLGAECVMVGEIQPDKETVNVVYMLLDGKEVDDFSYTLKGTPCQNVAENGFCIYPDDAARLFPESRDIAELNIRGYIGTPLRDSGGNVFGILCALSRSPLTSSRTQQEIMEIIAVKASAEVERVRMEREIRESEDKFRSIVETSPDMIWEVDMQGKFRYISPTVTTIMGYTPEEIIGMSITDLMPKEAKTFAMEELARHSLSGGAFSPIEIPARDRNGNERVIEIRPARLKGTEKTLNGFRGVAIDITERKRSEEALRQANKKLNLLSSINRHDIKNQLLTLDGFVALLHKKIPDPLYQEYFTRISTASSQIAHLINFTKEYEQIGVQAPTWQDVRILVENAGRDSVLGQISFINDLPATLEVFADPLIAKVFFNMADNAVRHGGKITTIRFSCEKRDGDRIIVCEDNGDGVAVDEKEKIFDLGYGKNTGFGLAISREILDITGITIKETGEAGRGARFEMTIPNGGYRFIHAERKKLPD
ncbi:MAG: PAS domain S-box protein [Methanoregula sp.]|nr:PAS domain S-box protein [Methanoregula sp.]